MTRARWIALALAVLAAAVYANAADNGFALDDQFIIEHNPRVHDVDSIPAAITRPYWPDAPTRIGLYRPFTVASYAVQWDLSAGDPLPFHLANIGLHVLVTLLVFLLLQPLAGLASAGLGSAVFAVHPVHVEAVANVVGQAELLAAAWVLAAAVLYLRGGLTASRRRLWGGAAAVAVAYFLGLASKEIAVTLPALLVLLEAGRPDNSSEAAPAGGGGGRRGLWERLVGRWPVYLLLALALVASLAARAAVLGTPVGNDQAGFLQPLSGLERLMTAVSVWPEYLRLMVFPVHLVADYSPGVLMPVEGFGPRVVAGLLVGALVSLVAVYAWARARSMTIGAAWFVVAVFPVSNLVIPIGVLLAERTLYLPSVGLALALGGAWCWLGERRPSWRRVVGVGLAAVVVLAGARTWQRTPTWRSTESVLEMLARDHPESFRIQWLVAENLRADGKVDQALDHFRRAVELVPDHYQLRMQHGQTLLQAGRPGQAVETLRAARNLVPELPEAHVFLMAALLQADRPAEAAATGLAALEWHPDHRGVHHQLAIALTRSGNWDAALRARRASIRLGGDRASWQQYLHQAELLVRLHRSDEAAAALAEARRRAPETASVPSLEALRRATETADTAVLPYR